MKIIILPTMEDRNDGEAPRHSPHGIVIAFLHCSELHERTSQSVHISQLFILFFRSSSIDLHPGAGSQEARREATDVHIHASDVA